MIKTAWIKKGAVVVDAAIIREELVILKKKGLIRSLLLIPLFQEVWAPMSINTLIRNSVESGESLLK
jgi:methylenetetrahydrofolate dehydrogenase (NADP+)/methenyltetrahydrofolate cyclohydrolase